MRVPFVVESTVAASPFLLYVKYKHGSNVWSERICAYVPFFVVCFFLAAEKCCGQKVAVVITFVTSKSRRSNTARNKNKVAFIVSFLKRK